MHSGPLTIKGGTPYWRFRLGVLPLFLFAVFFIRPHPIFSSESNGSKNLQEIAENGDCEAQVELGKRFFWGNGVEKNDEEARKWFLRAAQKDNAEAIAFLGLFSYQKNSPFGSFSEAFDLFSRAAEHGEPNGIFFLGLMNMRGRGVKRNYVQAYSWFKLFLDRVEKDSPNKRFALEWLAGITTKLSEHEIVEGNLNFFRMKERIPHFERKSFNPGSIVEPVREIPPASLSVPLKQR